MIKFLKPLINKDFRWLFASQFTNNLGMFLDYVALMSLLVYVWKKGPDDLASFSIVYAFPLIISPFAGALVDKWPLKRVMIVSCLVDFSLTLLLVFVNGVGSLLTIIFFRACSKTFYYPAESSVIKFMFKKDELIQANSLVHGMMQIFKIIGPVIGGGLLLLLRPRFIFTITASCYLLAGFFLFFIQEKYDRIHVDSEKFNAGAIFKDIVNMSRMFFCNYRLLFGFISITLVTFAFYLSDSMVTLFAKNIGFTERYFALVFVWIGFGGVLGAFLLGQEKKKRNLLLLILIGIITTGTSMLIGSLICPIAGRVGIWLFLAVWFCVGLGVSYATIPYTSLVMQEVSTNMIGKASTMSLFSTGVNLLIAPVIGAVLARWLGVSMPFIATGVVLVSAFVVLSFYYNKYFSKKKIYFRKGKNPENQGF